MAANDDQKKLLARAVDIINHYISHEQHKWQHRQFHTNMYNSYDELLRNKKPWQVKYTHYLPFLVTEMKTSFYEEGVLGSGGQGLWKIHPWSEFSVDSAEQLTKVFQYQENNSNIHRELYLGGKSKSMYGDWLLETYWDRQTKIIKQPDNFQIGFDGEIKRPVIREVPGMEQEFVKKNQPNIRTLDPNAVMTDPKACSWSEQRLYIYRQELTFDKLKEDQEKYNLYENVDMIKGTTMPKMASYFYDDNRRNIFVETHSDKYSKSSPIDEESPMVEVMHLINPNTGEWESIANRAVYLGRRQRYRNLTDPITHIKNYDSFKRFNGKSDYEVIVAHWRLINQYQSLEADNMLMHFRGYTKVARDAGPGVQEDMENLFPGAVITMNNLGGVDHTRPDLFSPQVSNQKQELINDTGRAMGLDEILRGETPGSNVRSQGQFAQLAQFGSKLLSRGVRTISEGLKEVGEKWLLLNYDYLDLDQIFPVTGPSGAEIIYLERDDIPPMANIAVRLSADLDAQKDRKLQQLMQAINLAQTNPGITTQEMIKDWFKTQGEFENVDKYFPLSFDEYTQLARANVGFQIEQQAAGVAEAQAGNVAQEPGLAGGAEPPPAPNPDQIAAGNINAGNPG